MFNAGYVVGIVSGGRVLEESRQDVVRLPFGSEYAVRLRNRTKRDAVAQIFIDGENVSKDGFIVRAGQFVDIECYVENLRNFRFVSADSYAAHAAGKGSQPDDRNGVVEVRWRAEVERPLPVVNVPTLRSLGYNAVCNFDGEELTAYTSSGPASVVPTSSIDFHTHDAHVKGILPQARSTEGCTVEGTHSSQRFRVGTIGELVPHDQAVVCRLFLKGPDLPAAGRTNKFCTECGRPPLPADRFCGSCGTPIHH